MTAKELQENGFVYAGVWNNRVYYKKKGFEIVEHQGFYECDDERADVWNKVCEYLIDNGEHKYLNEFLQFVLTHHGVYGCSTEPCEQCGDYVETYKLDI